MNILLDECIPLRMVSYFRERGVDCSHIAKMNLSGARNGDVYEAAKQDFDIFITTDKHFKRTAKFPPTKTLGIIYIRVTPTIFERIVASVDSFLKYTSLELVVGKAVVLRQNDFEFME